MFANGTMQVQKNGKQVWCAYYSVGSGKTRAFVRGFGDTEAEAIARREANMKKRFLSGGSGSIERQARSPKLSKYLVTWLDDYPPGKLGDETRRKYRRDLERHVLPHLDPPLADLTTEDLKKLFYKTLPESATRAARWNAYKTLRTLLNHAVKNGEIDVSPLRLVDAPTLEVKVKEADDKWINRRVSMTKYILRWIADPSSEFHDHYPRVLMMFLGLRRSEILGLEWSCVSNLEKKGKANITVKQQLKRHEDGSGWFIYRNAKNKKSRLVPLPELWRQALLQERDKHREATEEWAKDLVFLREDGRHVDYNTHADAWVELMTAYVNREKSEKKPIDETYYFRPHAARHVAASMMFDDGVPLEVAQQILGHSDTAITLYYTHLTRRAKQEAAETLGAALSEKFK